MDDYLHSQERMSLLFKNWTEENKRRLLKKMEIKGIDKGGILENSKANQAAYNWLKDKIFNPSQIVEKLFRALDAESLGEALEEIEHLRECEEYCNSYR